MAKISKDLPLAEITLRKYEKPCTSSKRELIKKLCLSLGLLQPGDSRDVIVDIFSAVINSNKALTSEEIRDKVIILRKKSKLSLSGIADSNIRRQVKRLRDMFFIEKIKTRYRINEKESLLNIYEQKIEKYYLDSISTRIKDYLKKL